MMLLLEEIANGKIINRSASDSMIRILRNQTDHTRAKRYLPFLEDPTR